MLLLLHNNTNHNTTTNKISILIYYGGKTWSAYLNCYNINVWVAFSGDNIVCIIFISKSYMY